MEQPVARSKMEVFVFWRWVTVTPPPERAARTAMFHEHRTEYIEERQRRLAEKNRET